MRFPVALSDQADGALVRLITPVGTVAVLVSRSSSLARRCLSRLLSLSPCKRA